MRILHNACYALIVNHAPYTYSCWSVDKRINYSEILFTVDVRCFAIIVLQWAIPYLYTFASNLFSIIINMLIKRKFVKTLFHRNCRIHSISNASSQMTFKDTVEECFWNNNSSASLGMPVYNENKKNAQKKQTQEQCCIVKRKLTTPFMPFLKYFFACITLKA